MSRIGKMPIAIPAGVTVEIAENNKVTVKGPKGTLERTLPGEMKITQNDGVITIERPNDLKKEKSLHGLTRSLLHNMVVGVSAGFEKKSRGLIKKPSDSLQPTSETSADLNLTRARASSTRMRPSAAKLVRPARNKLQLQSA